MELPNEKLIKSIVKTLCYAQIFSYPLTLQELWQYLLSHKKVSKEEIDFYINSNTHLFEKTQQYITLRGDKKLVSERKKRLVESRKKLAKALWISQILSCIPTVRLIGLSGSLSMQNAQYDDDIDLFFITKKNTVWTTRFFVNVTLLLLGEKRKRSERHAQDKICPNMFMSEDSLSLFDRNLYTAHEVAQMKVLFSKKHTYEKFLYHNKWVLKYMPHAFNVPIIEEKKTNSFLPFITRFTELSFYLCQYMYMKKRITNEHIEKDVAAFHPLKKAGAISSLHRLKTNSYLPQKKTPDFGQKEAQFSFKN